MISIVIPVLNEEKALPDCLRSLREQDYRGDFEILIVDNGSTDSSAGLARSLGARVVSSLVAGNVFYARKFGAHEARGDIIIQADADTIYPNDWLTRINRHFTAHPEVVAVAGTFRYREPTRLAGTEYFLRSAVAMMTKTIFGRPFIISGATFAFRREAFLKVGGYDLDAYAPDQYGMPGKSSMTGSCLSRPPHAGVRKNRHLCSSGKSSLICLLPSRFSSPGLSATISFPLRNQ
jgi:glycosyltransferase involved in cell wall biosynthesis